MYRYRVPCMGQRRVVWEGETERARACEKTGEEASDVVREASRVETLHSSTSSFALSATANQLKQTLLHPHKRRPHTRVQLVNSAP